MRVVPFMLVLSVFAACGGDPPAPGFEEVGGAGEGAGDAATTGSSTKAAGPSSTGVTSGPGATTSTTSTTGATTSTGPSGCTDLGPGEPNDSEATAHDLGTIGDCDDEGGSVSGLLDESGDADWYVYLGTDASSTCTVDPHRTITSSHPIRLCKFIQCLDNETNDFACPMGTTDAFSPDGRPGCCSAGDIDFSLTCGSSSLDSDDAYVYIRVDTTVNECVTYTLTYDY